MNMVPYRRLSGESGVVEYESAPASIRVRFVDGTVYTYSHARAGRHHVQEMKRLAREGKGLSGYISKHVRDQYDSKEPS
ncbi:hypothetical protein [Massilia sp. PAMC28688]|uniref:hypothetical protein n=1 Tax=Massilia sp. PAMC28688 TaxID=2861283 RepID=UPI0027D968AF|nr:hypothetical protein [Massilia sp. PAMC28688]